MLPKTAIAHHLNADPALVARWARRGMPLFSLEAAAAWHSANIRPRKRRKPSAAAVPATDPVAGDPPCRTWYDRRQRVLTMHAQRELDLLEGRALDRATTVAAWQKRLTAVRARLLAIPSKAAASVPPAWRAKVGEVVAELIDEALYELSGTTPEGRRRER